MPTFDAQAIIQEVVVRGRADGLRQVADEMNAAAGAMAAAGRAAEAMAGGVTKGGASAATAASALATALGSVGKSADAAAAVVSDALAKSNVGLATSLTRVENLSRKYVEGHRAAQDFAKVERDLETAVAKGATTREQANIILDGARAKLLGLKTAEENLAPSPGSLAMSTAIRDVGVHADRTREQLKLLAFQANDVVTMAALGAPVRQILASQGGQIAQVFMSGSGGIGEQFKSMGSELAAMITPVRIMTGGVIGLGVAAVAAMSSWRSAQDDLALSLEGLGRRSGATLDMLNQIAAAGADAGRMSTAQALGAVGTFAGAGLSPDIASGLLATTKPLARVFGVDVDEAAKQLAVVFKDPVKGADTLNEKLGFLNSTTRNYIQSLVDQNDLHGAQTVLLQALEKDLQDVTDRTNALGHAWEWLTRQGSNLWSGLGAGVDSMVYGAPLQAQLDAAVKARDEVQRYLKSGEAGMLGAGAEAGWRADLAAKQAEVDRLQKEVAADKAAAAQKAATITANQRTTDAAAAARTVSPQHDEFAALVAKRRDVGDALADPIARGGMDDLQIARLQEAWRGLGRAIETFISPAQRAAEGDRLALQAITARTATEQVAVAVAQKRLDLAGKAITAAEAERQVEAARAEVLARSTREAADQRETSQRNAAVAGLTGYARAMAALNVEYDHQIRLADGNAEAVKTLAEARALDVASMTAEAAAGPLRSAAGNLNSQIAILRVQRDTFGQSAAAIAEATEKQRLINQYMEQGVPITDGMTRAIDAYAAKAGEAAKASQDFADRQKQLISGLDAARDFGRDSIGGILKDLSHGKNPIDGLVNSLGGFGDKLIDKPADGIVGFLI